MPSHQPIRSCIACREKKKQQDLLRIVRTLDGIIEIDTKQIKLGRGVYLCKSSECFQLAAKKKSIPRSLKVQPLKGFFEALQEMLDAEG